MASQTNLSIVQDINRLNGVSDTERTTVVDIFLSSASTPVRNLIVKSIASMNQDKDLHWLQLKPKPPDIVQEPIPHGIDAHVRIAAIGGMAAYLNLIVHASEYGGKHCIITNPNDIFTFAAWTMHPEEDMDQRLVPMFRTPSLLASEFRRIFNLSAPPEHLRYKAFKIDYLSALRMLFCNPKAFGKLIKVNLEYIFGEFLKTAEHYALINLKRNRTTLSAFEDLDRIGNRPDHDVLNLPGRVVFEIIDEPTYYLKKQLKSQYGLMGKTITPEMLSERYGSPLPILEEIQRKLLRPMLYKGGYFWAGFKTNTMNLAREMGTIVFDDARVTRISVDRKSQKCVLHIQTDSKEIKLLADSVITALGDYGDDIISIDGVSTLFVIKTESKTYTLCPTGMGEGGTIHIVPVETVTRKENGKTVFYHLGKATNGAIVGRDPRQPKQLHKDTEFISHIEYNLKRILPSDAILIWITATECGRPVVARQSYRVTSLFEAHLPRVIDIAGGCGLGGNTPIIPEVQTILKERHSHG